VPPSASKLLPRKDVKAGDVILGLASSGPHSNGYSLVRKIVGDERACLFRQGALRQEEDAGGRPAHPTRIYVKPVLKAMKATKAVKALAHITGGGFIENIPRVLPKATVPEIDLDAVPFTPVFGWLQEVGSVAEREMLRTFNCGIGMIVVVAAKDAKKVAASLKRRARRS
jgi:phosphoribosylformylglycinamidine cyclo-ligase